MFRLVLIAIALLAIVPSASAQNPDGRPSITVSFGSSTSDGSQWADGYGLKQEYNGWRSTTFGPEVDLRFPTSPNVTFLVGGRYTRWTQTVREPLLLDDGAGTIFAFDLENKETSFGGYVGLRFYLGK